MTDAAAQEAFLQKNTFYCSRLKARISMKQCDINKNLPAMNDTITSIELARLKRTNISLYQTYMQGTRRPLRCDSCKGWHEEINLGVGKMGKCTREVCEQKAVARDLCGTHYSQERERQKATGDWKPKQTVHRGPRTKSVKQSGQFDKKPDLSKPRTSASMSTEPQNQSDLSTEPIPSVISFPKISLLVEIRPLTGEEIQRLFNV